MKKPLKYTLIFVQDILFCTLILLGIVTLPIFLVILLLIELIEKINKKTYKL